jgi:hypothetical protein
MRVLVIDSAARERIKQVIAHAEKNHYYIESGVVPGDDERFVAQLESYRVVFTFTHAAGKVCRHLSISVPSSKYANPFAAFAIADLFGFTGYVDLSGKPGDDWMIDINKAEHCIVIAQVISSLGS